MNHRFLLIPLLAAVCLVARGQEPSDNADVDPATVKLVSEARDLFVASMNQTGKPRLQGMQQAYAKLTLAAENDSSIPPARTMWAKMLTSAGDSKAGRVALQQATIEAPDDPEAYVILAHLALAGGQYAEAEALYIQADQQLESWDPSNNRRSQLVAQVATGRASIAQARSLLAKQAEFPDRAKELDIQAVDYRQQAVMAAPNVAATHQSLASALFNVGKIDAAKQAFEQARELDENLPRTEMWMARSFVVLEDYDSASAILQSMGTQYSDDLNVNTVAAELLMVMGEPETANRYLTRALKLKPDDLAARRLDAVRLRFVGDWPAATELLQKLNTEFPTDFSTANLLALTLSESESADDRQRAVSVATVTAQRFANQLKSAEGQRALVTLTWTAYASGQNESAKNALNQLLSIGIQPQLLSGDESYCLSRLLVEFGRPELAVNVLNLSLGRKAAFAKRTEAERLLAQLL